MKHLKSATEVERILAWRSDDFGHDIQALLDAESQALQEIGEDYLTLHAQLKLAVDALKMYASLSGPAMHWPDHDRYSYLETPAVLALAEIEKLEQK